MMFFIIVSQSMFPLKNTNKKFIENSIHHGNYSGDKSLLVWRSKASFDLSSVWQRLHLYLRFRWTSRCFLNPAIRLKVIGQSGHWIVFALWQIRCVCRLDEVLNLFPHSKHKNANKNNNIRHYYNWIHSFIYWTSTGFHFTYVFHLNESLHGFAKKFSFRILFYKFYTQMVCSLQYFCRYVVATCVSA